jgi:hypothetical protein
MPGSAVQASSKTYRKATKMVAEKLGVDAQHTDQPSEDFRRILEFIKTQPSEDVAEIVNIARAYFRLGARKGLRQAVKLMADRRVVAGPKWITLRDDVRFTARVKMPDGKQARISVEFRPENLGFTE